MTQPTPEAELEQRLDELLADYYDRMENFEASVEGSPSEHDMERLESEVYAPSRADIQALTATAVREAQIALLDRLTAEYDADATDAAALDNTEGEV